MMEGVFSRDLSKVIKSTVDLKILFIVLYLKKLILNSLYDYKKIRRKGHLSKSLSTASFSSHNGRLTSFEVGGKSL